MVFVASFLYVIEEVNISREVKSRRYTLLNSYPELTISLHHPRVKIKTCFCSSAKFGSWAHRRSPEVARQDLSPGVSINVSENTRSDFG